MVWIDYVIILVISFSGFISLIRGFVRETLSLITWACAFFFASHYYPFLTVLFTGFEDELIRRVIAMMVLFIATLIVGVMVNHIISSLAEKSGLSGIDRILGVFLGSLRGVLIISVTLFFLDTSTDFSKTSDWQQSQLIPKFSYIIRCFFDHLKSTSVLHR